MFSSGLEYGFGHAGFLVLSVTTLAGVAAQLASLYLWAMDDVGAERTAALGVANTVSGLVLSLGNVVGMALLVAALVAGSSPISFGARAGGFEPTPGVNGYDAWAGQGGCSGP